MELRVSACECVCTRGTAVLHCTALLLAPSRSLPSTRHSASLVHVTPLHVHHAVSCHAVMSCSVISCSSSSSSSSVSVFVSHHPIIIIPSSSSSPGYPATAAQPRPQSSAVQSACESVVTQSTVLYCTVLYCRV
jgi:hypothetical protein